MDVGEPLAATVNVTDEPVVTVLLAGWVVIVGLVAVVVPKVSVALSEVVEPLELEITAWYTPALDAWALLMT